VKTIPYFPLFHPTQPICEIYLAHEIMKNPRAKNVNENCFDFIISSSMSNQLFSISFLDTFCYYSYHSDCWLLERNHGGSKCIAHKVRNQLCLVSPFGTPSSIIVTTLIVGCLREIMKEANTLHKQHAFSLHISNQHIYKGIHIKTVENPISINYNG